MNYLSKSVRDSNVSSLIELSKALEKFTMMKIFVLNCY